VSEGTLERKGCASLLRGRRRQRHSLATRKDGMSALDARFEDWLSPVPRAGLRLPAALRVAEWAALAHARCPCSCNILLPSVGDYYVNILSRMTLTTTMESPRLIGWRNLLHGLKRKEPRRRKANPE
jgi:hypothetical protein